VSHDSGLAQRGECMAGFIVFRIIVELTYSWFQNLSDSGSPGTKKISLYKKL